MLFALNKVIEEAVPGGARMRRKKLIQELWAGYGEIVRVSLEDGRSLVVKAVSPPADDGTVSHRRKVKSYAVEAAFYERYAPKLEEETCRVARLVAAREDEGDAWLILEDLDAAGFDRRLGEATLDDAKTVVRWLAAFHKTFLGCAPEALWEHGCYWHLATRPDELAKLKKSDDLRTFAADIDACLATARHKTLVHGDAKLANFCFSTDAVAAVDFQYVGAGAGVRDLAYFLGSCFDEDDLQRHADDLLAFYFAQLAAPPDLEREWRALWPFCFADFERFLKGWDPSHWKRNGYTKQMTDDALHSLRFLRLRKKKPGSASTEPR